MKSALYRAVEDTLGTSSKNEGVLKPLHAPPLSVAHHPVPPPLTAVTSFTVKGRYARELSLRPAGGRGGTGVLMPRPPPLKWTGGRGYS